MKALVIGGTGFIGKRLVSSLLDSGNEVTIATTGRSANPFGERVNAVKMDRFNQKSLEDAVSIMPNFDVLYDQVGYGPDDVASTCRLFEGKIDHYVFTSSGSVYNPLKIGSVEEDFDPASSHPLKGGIKDLGYAEGKRAAESFLYKKAPFKYAAVRFPIVIGHDDVAKRFQFHVTSVLEGRKIVIPSPCGKMNYVWVEDAGRFLSWIGTNRKEGVYNAASSYMINAKELVHRIGEILGKTPIVSDHGNEKDTSPYYTETGFSLVSTKAEKEGFRFTPFDEWFPVEVKKTIERLKKSQ